MAIDPSIIAAGVAALGSGANAYAQGKQNKKSRKWNEKMHGVIRGEALADYDMQNRYNSPEEQMKRLKKAGLNPNLVYGNGTLANEGATVKPAGVDSWNPQAPRPGDAAVGAISAYYDTKMKSATIDNLTAQNTVIANEAILKLAQIIATQAGVEKTKVETKTLGFDLSLKETLRSLTIAKTDAEVNKILADTEYTLDQNDRAAATNAMTIKEAVERILNSRQQRAKSQVEIDHIKQQIENLKQDNTLKQFDVELQKKGIPRQSSTWWKIIGTVVQGGGGNLNPINPPGTKSFLPMPWGNGRRKK